MLYRNDRQSTLILSRFQFDVHSRDSRNTRLRIVYTVYSIYFIFLAKATMFLDKGVLIGSPSQKTKATIAPEWVDHRRLTLFSMRA